MLYRSPIKEFFHARSSRLPRQGHAGPARPADAGTAAAPWGRYRRPHFSDHARDVPDQGGIAVPRPPPPGTGRMDRGGMGNASEGPPHQVLPSDSRGTPPSVG